MKLTPPAEENHAGRWGVAMVLSGTFSTVLMKLQYSTYAIGTESCNNGDATTYYCPFNKPWFGVLEMKFAMACCLVYLYVRKAVSHRSYLETPLLHRRRNKKSTQRPLLATAVSSKSVDPTWNTILLIIIPSILDLLQTVLGNIGLIWISSSVYQMARGSMIIFSALLSVKYMNKTLARYQLVSLAIVCVSIILVGLSDLDTSSTGGSSTTSSSNLGNKIIGLVFIILAQLLCAIQIVLEEHLLTTKGLTPVMLVGYEGLWGLLTFVVVGPLLTVSPAGSTSAFSRIWHEDFVDSFTKLSNSPSLMVLVLSYVVCVGSLNVTGGHVTKYLSAIVRSILETVRTLGVWLLGLVMYYIFHWSAGAANSPAEKWTSSSWLELVGFAFMVYGTMTYKKLLKIPISGLYQSLPTTVSDKSPFMSALHK